MIPQTFVLSINAGWQNTQLFCTQGEAGHPFRFKVANGQGFLNLSTYTKIVLAIEVQSTVIMPVCTMINDYEVEVAIPADATSVSGNFPCWFVLIGDGLELRLGGISLQCNPCGIDQLLQTDPSTQGLLEQLIEQGAYAKTQGDYAKIQGDYAKEQGVKTEQIIERWEGIPAGEFDSLFPIAIKDGGTGATTASQALSNLGAAASIHNHTLSSSQIQGTLPISKGGTGATTASQALSNLGAAASIHNHTLSSSQIQGTLPISKGGTGAVSAENAIDNLGAAKKDHTHDFSSELITGINPISKGGTGAASEGDARSNLGIGEQLWSGSWSEGQITVNNLTDYTMYYLNISGSNTLVPVFRKLGSLRGANGYFSINDYGHIFFFGAAVSGNTLTYEHLIDVSISRAGNLGFSEDRTVSAIYGVF